MKMKFLRHTCLLALTFLAHFSSSAQAQDSCLSVLIQTKLAITIDNKLARPISFTYQDTRYALQPGARKDFYYTYTAPRCSSTLIFPTVRFDQKTYQLANEKFGHLSYSFYDKNGQMELSYNVSDKISADEFKVRELYRTCLGREAESLQVVRSWMMDRNAQDGICGSPESKITEVQERAVDYAYRKCLGRAVESMDAKNYWVNIAKTSSPLIMHEGICNSPEANQGLNL